MNYFYFPRLKSLSTTLTIANFPPRDGAGALLAERVLHACWIERQAWRVQALTRLSTNNILTVTQAGLADICPPESEKSLFLFMYPRDVSGSVESLPLDDRIESVPAWRANLRLSSRTTGASFQGEYPATMMRREGGTVVSFVPFIQRGADVETKMLFVNLTARPSETAGEIRIVDSVSRELLMTATVYTNRCTVVPLDSIEQDEQSIPVVLSDRIAGAPQYLSHNADLTELSLEHTHPPAEFMVGGDRLGLQRSLKQWWLSA